MSVIMKYVPELQPEPHFNESPVAFSAVVLPSLCVGDVGGGTFGLKLPYLCYNCTSQELYSFT